MTVAAGQRWTVVGGGAWGTALANAAASAGRAVRLLVRDPADAASLAASRENRRYLPGVPIAPGIDVTAEEATIADADGVLVVVPAQAVFTVLARLAPHLRADVPLVLCAKGIEAGTGRFVGEVAEAAAPGRPIAILSGPSFAADVARGLPTAVTLASKDPDRAAALAAALSGPTFRIYHSADTRGVEIGGAAKNVLAIAAGIVSGLGLGESARAAVVARGFAEINRFALVQGARPETLMGLSGLGDLVLTCGSESSRNFALGRRIGAEGPGAARSGSGKLAEGVFSADALCRLARGCGVEMPLAEAVADVLAGRATVDEAAGRLMARPLRPE